MGVKQSSPVDGVRVRSFSGSDVTGVDGLGCYAGGRVQYSSDRSDSVIIPGRRDETLLVGSLPAHLTPPSHLLTGFHCPVCSRCICCDEVEVHLLMCFSKPRLSYNDDVLDRDSGECSICLDELREGHSIARLPCLCIYHKGCIDAWFQVNRSCPEHPAD